MEIKPDGLQEIHESVVPPVCTDKESTIRAIRESGIVGLGGAGFPTSVKLSPPPGRTIDVLVINGAECEPFITSDYREMMENPEYVIEGTKRSWRSPVSESVYRYREQQAGCHRSAVFLSD